MVVSRAPANGRKLRLRELRVVSKDALYLADQRQLGRETDTNDCRDTRQRVLIAESLIPPALDEADCKVLSRLWFDPYTEMRFTAPRIDDRNMLEIDHLVPAKEAHISGAYLLGPGRMSNASPARCRRAKGWTW